MLRTVSNADFSASADFVACAIMQCDKQKCFFFQSNPIGVTNRKLPSFDTLEAFICSKLTGRKLCLKRKMFMTKRT